MHNFYFAGHYLSEFAGRIGQAPAHQIAQRDFELVEIPGRSGDIIQDNGRYKNVSFKLQIYFLPYLSEQTARQLAYAVIDWLGAFNGYQEYRDTYNPDYYTKAVITNLDEIKRELPTLLSTTIEFSRIPFWYRLDGRNEIELPYDTEIKMNNSEVLPAEPTLIYRKNTQISASPYLFINSELVTFDKLKTSLNLYIMDGLTKSYKGYDDNNNSTHISPTLPPNLKTGLNSFVSKRDSKYGTFYVIPNWRRL
jgi:phage-related protein